MKSNIEVWGLNSWILETEQLNVGLFALGRGLSLLLHNDTRQEGSLFHLRGKQ